MFSFLITRLDGWYLKVQATTYSTHPKINMEPENDGLEDDFPFPGLYSQVPC